MTPTGSSSITVIVCTRDRPALLEQCLCALSKQTIRHFDTLVVDNAPTRPIRDICERWGANWVLAPTPGLTHARNVGARLAQGEIIVYIDDDAVPEADWLELLVEDFRDPEIAAVTGRVHYMKAQGDSRAISDEEASAGVVRMRRVFDQKTPRWFALACFGGIGDGGNMAFRRRLITSVQPFDERLGRGRALDSGDEHVLFASLLTKGYRIAHNPSASVRHPSPPTLELQKARRFSDLRSSIAHLLFVWGEFPGYRIEVLRFLFRAMRKRMIAVFTRQPAMLPVFRMQALRAMFGGALVYLATRRGWSGRVKTARRQGIAPVPEISGHRAAGN